jgi:hypothetical protein
MPKKAPLSRRSFLRFTTMAAGAVFVGCSSIETEHQSATDFASPSQPTPLPIPEILPARSPIEDSTYAPPKDFQPQVSITPPPPKSILADVNAIIPRTAWTTAKPVKPCLPLGGVSLITFHHDGDPGGYTESGFAETAGYLERIRAYHAKTGFQDIGYHYAIDRAGRVWELRSIAYRGEHVREGYDQNHVLHKWNDHNIGVVVLGNFMLQNPTDAQKQRICAFGAQLRKHYRLSIAQVRVHQELVSTECPGVHLRPL